MRASPGRANSKHYRFGAVHPRGRMRHGFRRRASTTMPIDKNTSFEELLKVAAVELKQLRRREPVTLELKPLEAWALLGNLQLALSDEHNRGASARIGRRIARMLARAVATTPALRELATRGWKREIPGPIGN
jgi:hypothetical protein